jgi:hypothetical protein
MMKDCQIVDAVYEHETLHPLTPLRGLKEQARVRLRVWLAEGDGGQIGRVGRLVWRLGGFRCPGCIGGSGLSFPE